jgi:UBX domain-containing protein 1
MARLVATVNLTHTVGDLRNFIMAASPASNGRAFILQTTFPNKELSNQSETIGAAGLKNAVIVQRFT